MTYRDTARAFVAAESPAKNGRPDNPQALAADTLPLSEWAASRREFASPLTIAHNHAAHVSDAAHALREALDAHERAENGEGDTAPWLLAIEVDTAARALLAAIGEAEPDKQPTNDAPKESAR